MINNEKMNKIYKEFKEREINLSKYATTFKNAFRKEKNLEQEIRSPYAIDRDRILYSGAYRRYQGKTQVFSFTNLIDEEMSNRSLHTTYVSQISRTIGKVLNLNLDLIEAISLGHDLGHTPFGHDGEKALSKMCEENNIGMFHHNIESLHIVDHISNGGDGLNLTFQVRDGIISHDGEVHNKKLSPDLDKNEDQIQDYINKKKAGKKFNWMPSTLEGCVVRASDTIAYIGQDIEDAVRFKILTTDEIPKHLTSYFGCSNSEIIDVLVKSIITESYKKDYIAFDEETSDYLFELKKFNYKRIYTSPSVKAANEKIFTSMRLLFNMYLEDLKCNNHDSKIYSHFLNHKNNSYLEKFNNAEKVRDFIATMTDRYFNEEVKNYLLPGKLF